MSTHPFVRAVCDLKFENTFNPYVDRCETFDRVDAARTRAAALEAMIESAMAAPVDAIWVGRDLGYRGGRRTGLALTDEVNASAHMSRWGVEISRPTIGAVVAERTAAVIWTMLAQIEARIFLWNVFPLHPHEPGQPFTNRNHNAKERRAGEDILASLIGLLRPKRIFAIGNDASQAVSRVNDLLPILPVRHPSYGGQTQFLQQIREAYALETPQPSMPLLL
ncbi:uracil-DNA glycosylase [Sphingomonas sp. QA11]|uniref:uracil-DNA glycosylase n=1 Tax=Sphingomonas sp. QA11 TaxID=2950605 RepID=UPI0023490B26|nr:uracil-DNA glycosylase [Sphingomonas sp. QA11]WCM28141.1 uracil-DNA glycosylase [Sphingomonas sp. QA11]